MTKSELLDELKELEQRALEWGDRWIAANQEFDAKFAISCVRPISFDRAEVERAEIEAVRNVA